MLTLLDAVRLAIELLLLVTTTKHSKAIQLLMQDYISVANTPEKRIKIGVLINPISTKTESASFEQAFVTEF